jgi:hypothetical protein
MNKQVGIALSLTLLLGFLALAVAVALNPRYIRFQELSEEQVLKLLTYLTVVGLFVERAAQVIVMLKDGGAKADTSTRIKAHRKGVTVLSQQDLQKLVDKAAEDSKNRAVLSATATFLLGLFVAFVGVRCLRPLFDPLAFDDLGNVLQVRLFGVADILITGALIGGGAAGIHHMSEFVVGAFRRGREILEKDK